MVIEMEMNEMNRRMKDKVIRAMKRTAIKDLEQLKDDIEMYINLLKNSDVDVEITALIENAKRRANAFEYSRFELRV